MSKAKDKAGDTPFERLTEFAKRVIQVPKEEVSSPKPKPKPRKRRKMHGGNGGRV